jgi:ABC-2 type transport system ATP-binding protein
MITTNALSKQFNGNTAVQSLTLDIAAGEVFGFLGPNGAGKTTTVRMLACLIAPSSGSATVFGLTVGQEDQDIRRNVGILTETPGLYDRLSAWQNLTIFAELYEVDKVAYQVEKYLRLLGLWERRDDPAGSFSKGMRQKLAIARALLHEPPVLFLDEPTAALDPEAARLVRDFIAELKSEGRTIFICTHNLDEADRLCDRVAVFKQTLRVVDRPANLRHLLHGRQVKIQLAGEALPYVPHLAALPQVQHVQANGRDLLLTLADPETDNPALIRLLVAEGAAVQYVSEVQQTLEDAYLHLLDEDDNAESAS